jgi:hypothetical protein
MARHGRVSDTQPQAFLSISPEGLTAVDRKSTKEIFMVFRWKRLLDFVFASSALVVSIFASPSSVEARLPRTAQSQEQVSVVGHLDLHGMQVKQIFVQERSGKNYLLLRRADQNAFAIVNVSDPAKPLLADRDDLRQPAGAEVDLPRPGSALAIAFVPERNSAPAVSAMPASAITLPTESVRLIDLTDPQHPKTVKIFNRVTSVASDDGRKLVFLVNNEGLWIVSHHRNHPLPMCTSESEIEPLPDCQ